MLQEIENTTQTKIDDVTMSASAIEAVRSILAQKNLVDYSLRVFVAGSSCSGVNYGMALDNNIQESDFKFQNDDIQIVVDSQSIEYLHGAKIDFVNDPVKGAGFMVDSPFISSGCSCGSEGHSHSEEEGSSCSCGGSCGCGN